MSGWDQGKPISSPYYICFYEAERELRFFVDIQSRQSLDTSSQFYDRLCEVYVES